MRAQIDDITESGGGAAGLTWHVELDGVPFPFGRGASFVRVCGSSGKLCYARDIPEPSSKPGGAALVLIGLLARLLRAIPGALPAAAAAAGATPRSGSGSGTRGAPAAKQRAAQQQAPPPPPPPLPGCVGRARSCVRVHALALR
jgi:hypothetical protein